MKSFLIAPTAFKGTLSPAAVARAMAEGARQAHPGAQILLSPLADGGDGTLECIKLACGGRWHRLAVQGPLGEPHMARWLSLKSSAVLELAEACGIALYRGDLRPLEADTFALGQMLSDCLKRGGSKEIVIALGGSASTDGGTGALRALGARFLDASGRELPGGGGFLVDLDRVDLEALRITTGTPKVTILTDVTNCLLGPNGAACVFAPQKGASSEQVALMERGLSRLADKMENAIGKRLRHEPGTGAAGGAAFGLALALDAKIISGFAWLSELIGLDSLIAACQVVLTGEGRLDRQSLSGKALGHLARMCKSQRRALWAIAGEADLDVDWQSHGISKVSAPGRQGKFLSLEDIRELTLSLCQSAD